MPEYIDRQKLLKALSYEGTCRSKNSESPDLLRGLVIAILVAKKEVETADVAPVVHTAWIFFCGVGEHFPRCSRCGEEADEEIARPYCAFCGARMDMPHKFDYSDDRKRKDGGRRR